MFDAERSLSTSWYLLLWWLSAQVTSAFSSVCSEFFYLGGDYGAHEGSFESPGYATRPYPGNIRCTWIIKVPQNYRVRLYFNDFDIEWCRNANNNCSCDAVEVYSGELLISQRLARFCGNELPPAVLSSGRYMRVDLISDEDTGKKGFAASFHSVSPDLVTPSTLDRNDGKSLKNKPTTTEAPSGSSSTLMIAIVCSLAAILIISSVVLYIYMRHQKQNPRRNRREETEMASPIPLPRFLGRNEPVDPPPPYQTVVLSPPNRG